MIKSKTKSRLTDFEVAPDWFKFEELSAALSKKFNSRRKKAGEISGVSFKSK